MLFLREYLSHIQFNQIFSAGEPRSLVEQIRDLPVLLRHLWSYFWRGHGLNLLFRLRLCITAVMGLLYLTMPFDVLPGMDQ